MGTCAHEDWRAEQRGEGALHFACAACGALLMPLDYVAFVGAKELSLMPTQARGAVCRAVYARVAKLLPSPESEQLLQRATERALAETARCAGVPTVSPDAAPPGTPVSGIHPGVLGVED